MDCRAGLFIYLFFFEVLGIRLVDVVLGSNLLEKTIIENLAPGIII